MGLFFLLFWICIWSVFWQNLGPFRFKKKRFWVCKNNWGHCYSYSCFRDRLTYLKQSLTSYLTGEQEMASMLSKCRQEVTRTATPALDPTSSPFTTLDISSCR